LRLKEGFMKKQDNLAKIIEDQAREFKLRTKRSPYDMKKHGGIQPDEADAMKAAHDKLDWPDAKTGRVFDRDPRTVRKKV
jgi:hypothetical protein